MLAFAAPFRGTNVLAEEAPAEHTPDPIIPLTEEIIVGTIAFAILAFVLMKFVFPRMEQTFQARVEAIEGGIKRAEERQAEANALFEQYKLQLAEARTEAARIRQEAAADAGGTRQGLPARARAEAGGRGEGGRDVREAERRASGHEPRGDVGDLAVDLASRLVGESLAAEARQRATVEGF